MRLLLDTHAFLWWLADDPRLPQTVHESIASDPAEVFVSAATAWEIATKHRIGKLPDVTPIVSDLARAISGEGFLPLAVTVLHGQQAGGLPGHHRDPFDRMLVAQAMTENLTLVSNESIFDAYGVARLW